MKIPNSRDPMTTRRVSIYLTISILHLSWVFVSGRFVIVPKTSSCNGRSYTIPCFAAMGFGKDSGQKKINTKSSPPTISSSSASLGDKKKVQLQQRILQQYGGDIAKGTQERMDQYMAAQPQHIQLAAELYRKVTRWDAYILSLTPQQRQTLIPPRDVDAAERARQELQDLYQRHGIHDFDLHNLFQKFTWDASADAKAARAMTGQMPVTIQQRVNEACEYIGQSVRSIDGRKGRCLDVGCGYGVLVPSLLNSGVLAGQYFGVDLSSEMIRNAKETYRGMNFIAADFIKEFQDNQGHDSQGFDGIIFCSSLHDLPDAYAAIEKAVSLLRPRGRIVIVHPQGARHVIEQIKANPTMVRRALPTEAELKQMASEWSLVLEHSPEEAYSRGEGENGYLAVLTKPLNAEE